MSSLFEIVDQVQFENKERRTGPDGGARAAIDWISAVIENMQEHTGLDVSFELAVRFEEGRRVLIGMGLDRTNNRAVRMIITEEAGEHITADLVAMSLVSALNAQEK